MTSMVLACVFHLTVPAIKLSILLFYQIGFVREKRNIHLSLIFFIIKTSVELNIYIISYKIKFSYFILLIAILCISTQLTSKDSRYKGIQLGHERLLALILMSEGSCSPLLVHCFYMFSKRTSNYY